MRVLWSHLCPSETACLPGKGSLSCLHILLIPPVWDSLPYFLDIHVGLLYSCTRVNFICKCFRNPSKKSHGRCYFKLLKPFPWGKLKAIIPFLWSLHMEQSSSPWSFCLEICLMDSVMICVPSICAHRFTIRYRTPRKEKVYSVGAVPTLADLEYNLNLDL